MCITKQQGNKEITKKGVGSRRLNQSREGSVKSTKAGWFLWKPNTQLMYANTWQADPAKHAQPVGIDGTSVVTVACLQV